MNRRRCLRQDATVTATESLPTWDTTSIFPSLESRELSIAHEAVVADVARLVALYDRHDVRGGDKVLDDDAVAAVEEVLAATNDLLEQSRVVEAYAYAFTSTDATNDRAQSLRSTLAQDTTPVRSLLARLGEWIHALGVDELLTRSELAAEHGFPLRRAVERVEHQMGEHEEKLAASLSLTGSSAWSRLYRDLASSITATVDRPDGTSETLPMSAVRGLATDPDEGVRHAAFTAELAAWEANAIPIAAAMNAIKGESLTLNDARGWPDPIEPVLFSNNVERTALDAMLAAVEASLPDWGRYLRTKARLLGKEQLAFWDLFAPVPSDTERRPWSAAIDAVTTAFGGYSPQLAALARRAAAEQWIDAGPRAGKEGGAFCMSVRPGESRVLMNFNGSFDSVQTLAHELGHAYHNVALAERTPMQRQLPMALAETASIFCETIMVAEGLATASDDERLVILEGDLQGSCQVVVDIYSRFLFERSVFERRRASTLSVRELCDLMHDAQVTAYGDGLAADALHPYMWAAKPHYYGSTFYNWPYTFGLLFGIGLYARYQADPDAFRNGYDDLLSSTGLGSAAELAARFDIDITSVDFWTSSLDVLRGRIDELDALVP
jgi:pepF/M3 family oligoendopeptidase